MKKPILQVALDLLELKRAVQIAREAVAGGADWIEAGNPAYQERRYGGGPIPPRGISVPSYRSRHEGR